MQQGGKVHSFNTMLTTKEKTSISARREKLRQEAADATRERIKTSKLLDRLQAFALGEKIDGKAVKLSPSEIKAMEILFDKTLPNLASIKHEVEAKQVTFLIDTQPDAADDSVQTAG